MNNLFVNRAEDHLEEALRNIEELSEKLAEQDTTIKSLRKQVTKTDNTPRQRSTKKKCGSVHLKDVPYFLE